MDGHSEPLGQPSRHHMMRTAIAKQQHVGDATFDHDAFDECRPVGDAAGKGDGVRVLVEFITAVEQYSLDLRAFLAQPCR